MFEPTARLGHIAILSRGDEEARRNATPETSRFKAVFAALREIGVDAEPVIYEDDVLDAVRMVASAAGGFVAIYWLDLGVPGFSSAVAAGFCLYAAKLVRAVFSVKTPNAAAPATAS